MALNNDPSLLFGNSGNALANTTLRNFPNLPSSVSFMIDASNALGCYLQIWSISTGVVVNTLSGTLINSYSTPDNTWYDTNTYGISYNMLNVANTTLRQTFFLDTGKYNIALINTDPLNNINVMATTGLLV